MEKYNDIQLGLMLNQEYQKLAVAQGNIGAIIQEMTKRASKEKVENKEDEESN